LLPFLLPRLPNIANSDVGTQGLLKVPAVAVLEIGMHAETSGYRYSDASTQFPTRAGQVIVEHIVIHLDFIVLCKLMCPGKSNIRLYSPPLIQFDISTGSDTHFTDE
jgi:hypothetical protein